MTGDENIIKNEEGVTTSIKLVWSIEDVIGRAEETDVKLTDKQAGDVLDYCYHEHDATIGMNWDVIDYYIDLVLKG